MQPDKRAVVSRQLGELPGRGLLDHAREPSVVDFVEPRRVDRAIAMLGAYDDQSVITQALPLEFADKATYHLVGMCYRAVEARSQVAIGIAITVDLLPDVDRLKVQAKYTGHY